MYAEDSFFTLGTGGQIALLSLTLTLTVLCCVLVFWWVAGLGRLVRVLIALVVFYVFIWVSPQIYYALYWLFDMSLPVQWVVQSPPSPMKILKLLTFTDRATLTEHGQGLLGWGLMLIALLRRRPKAD